MSVGSNLLLEAALAYAGEGWLVFPCRPHRKEPLTEHGVKDAMTDPSVITAWWTRWPDANVAIATGAPSGLVVLDIDKKPEAGIDGEEPVAALQASRGALPETVEQITGSGGRQLFFRQPGGTIPNSAGKFGAGLDVRGDNGYVIVPPSIHPNGRRYAWELSHHPDEIPLADLPSAWIALLQRSGTTGTRSPSVDLCPPIAEGHRNDALFRLGCQLRAWGFSEAAIDAALQVTNQERCRPPLLSQEVERIAQSIARYPTSRTPHGDRFVSRPAPPSGRSERYHAATAAARAVLEKRTQPSGKNNGRD